MTTTKRILVAPLNWGLGHASRCVPLIRELLFRKAEVILAGEGAAFKLLQKEFPQLEAVHLEGITITYPRKGNFSLYFFLRLPMLFRLLKKENTLLNKIIEEKKIDAVISDNRYGVYSGKVKTAFITHQLFIKSPYFNSRLRRMVKNRVLKFDECWVPDYKGELNLSGSLSHANQVPRNVKYIGPLSRFTGKDTSGDYKRKILVVLSGPEPKRSMLEEKLTAELKSLKIKTLIVRGVVEENKEVKVLNPELSTVNFLNSMELESEIHSSELIICRSGYSSVMDLVQLEKKALLIPTPGQTEQEYLADHLQSKGWFYSVSEENMNLQEDIEKAMNFEQNFPKRENINFQFLDDFLANV